MKNTNIHNDEFSVHNNPLTKRVNSTFSNLKILSNHSPDYHQKLKEEKNISNILKDNMLAFMQSSGESFHKNSHKTHRHKDKARYTIITSSSALKNDVKRNEFNPENSNKTSSKYFNDKLSKISTRCTTKYKDFFPSPNLKDKKEIKKHNKENYDKNNKTLTLISKLHNRKTDKRKRSSKEIPEFNQQISPNSSKNQKFKKNLPNLRLHLNKFYDYFQQEQKEAEYLNKIIENYDKNETLKIKQLYNKLFKDIKDKRMIEDVKTPSKEKQLPFFYSDSKRRKFNFRLSAEESDMNYKEKVYNFDKCSFINEDVTYKYRDYILNKFQVNIDRDTINFSIPKIKMRPIIPTLELNNDQNHDKVKNVLKMSKSDKTILYNRVTKNINLRKETLQRKLNEKKHVDESELDKLFKL